MASIDKRADGRYRARWREYPGGPQKTRHFTRKGDAERFLDGVRGDLARGQYVDPAGGRVLFREYAEQWRADPDHRAVDGVAGRDLPPGPRVPVARQAPARRDPPQRDPGVGEGPQPRCCHPARSRSCTDGSRASSRRRSAIGSSPRRRASASRCRSASVREIVPLEVDEVERLVAAMPDRYRALIVFAAGTGLRQGECFGLTVGPRRLPPSPGARRSPAPRASATVSRSSGRPRARPASGRCRLPPTVTDALAAHLSAFATGPRGAGVHQHASAGRCGGARSARRGTGRPARRAPRVGDVPRPPPLLRLAADLPGLLGQGGPAAPRPPVGDGDARHLQPPLARQRRRDA